MKFRTLVLLASLVLIAFHAAVAASAEDEAKIRARALDYGESWFAGDAARMSEALHPDMIKRIPVQRNGQMVIEEMGTETLVAMVARGGGKNAPASERTIEVRILDIYRNVATVRVEMHGWVDHLQLARLGDEWKIVNILWDTRPR